MTCERCERLEKVVSMLNSMVICGDTHSYESRMAVHNAMRFESAPPPEPQGKCDARITRQERPITSVLRNECSKCGNEIGACVPFFWVGQGRAVCTECANPSKPEPQGMCEVERKEPPQID